MQISIRGKNPMNADPKDEESKKPKPGRKEHLQQKAPPITKENTDSKVYPWMKLCKGKVVNYDVIGMSLWKSLFIVSYTTIARKGTYRFLWLLWFVCSITQMILYFTDLAKSVSDTVIVFSRVQYVLSFVIAGERDEV